MKPVVASLLSRFERMVWSGQEAGQPALKRRVLRFVRTVLVLGRDLAIRAVAPWVLLGAMIATSFFLVMRNRIRSNVDVLGLLVVSPLLIDVLSKYTGVYYKLPAFFFLILWDRTRRRSGGVPWIAITYIAIFSLLDSLPLGVHPASFEMREQVVRAAIKVPLYIGLFVHLLRSIPEEDIGPIQMTGASRPICGS